MVGHVPMHVCAKYRRCSSIGMGVMNNFREINAYYETKNADSDVKVKVTGVDYLACMKLSCPNAYVCQILKV